MSPTKKVKLGVFIPGGAQLLDTACVDIFAMGGQDYIKYASKLPQAVRDQAPDISILYIAPGKTIPLTAEMNILATHDLSHPDVQPGLLDVLLVPGPEPGSLWDEATLEFLRRHARVEATDILCVCTGIELCAAAGITEGKTVSGPMWMQDGLKKQYPGTKWVGDKYRWIQDGNFWSSGGITNGNDLVAAYARGGKHFSPPLAEFVCKMADVGDRPQRYD
ncbi:uncharacterized protein DNG_10432 [Cephalotrichum gorgonifer]|uniref:DJ-1/PfpI domain-containing protein n=1 Tax=Cephalotrichum gorgonifer TaxID=2041049 RepID=A0AAE8N9B0_9PEZI|nr:uncharacterized protein DNG_10432 [Cephalotrichum gorgonifer]